jgi:hypothetical protein
MSRRYTFFVHMVATKQWLSLDRDRRNRFTQEVLNPIFEKYPSVRVRFYDVEAFTARCSDIAVFETEEIQDYYFTIDAIRDTEIFTVPYFNFVEVIPGIEGGFTEYEEHLHSN